MRPLPANVAMAPIGGLVALLVTGTNFSVSSGVGFLALFGVSVQTGVIMLEYINQLRARGHTIEEVAVDGAVLRLRPTMMTMLVATFGVLPAAHWEQSRNLSNIIGFIYHAKRVFSRSSARKPDATTSLCSDPAKRQTGSGVVPGKRGGLNGSTQH